MALLKLDLHPERGALRWFGALWFPLFCGMLAWIALRAGAPPAVGWVLLGAAAVSIPVALLAPRLLRPVWIGTIALTFPIGFVVSHVLLAIAYYLVLTPAGLLLRLAGRDPLERRPDPSAPTYWVPRGPPPPAERYFRQF